MDKPLHVAGEGPTRWVWEGPRVACCPVLGIVHGSYVWVGCFVQSLVISNHTKEKENKIFLLKLKVFDITMSTHIS